MYKTKIIKMCKRKIDKKRFRNKLKKKKENVDIEFFEVKVSLIAVLNDS